MTGQLEVVKFACGLSKNPTSLVERISELFVDNTLSDIRKVPTYSTGYSETGIVDILIPIAKEVEDRAVGPFCNRFLHYVLRPGIPMRSKMYIFRQEILPLWTEDLHQRASSSETIPPQSCSIIVKNPHMTGHDVLAMIARLNQTITDLYIEGLRVDEETCLTDRPVFKMDPNAKTLIISNSQLPSSVKEDLALQSINYLTLEAIHVSHVSQMGTFVENFHVSKTLRHLNIGDCDLSSEESLTLCRQLRNLNQIQTLDLSYNSLGSAGAIIIAESIRKFGSLSQLQDLNLGDCSLCKSGSTMLIQALSKCKLLQFLSLSRNPIGNDGGEYLSKSITSWGPEAELEILSLQECDLCASSSFALMKSLASCKRLNYLNLSDNQIDGLFRNLIKDSAWKLPSLDEMRIASTGLGEEDIQALTSLVDEKRLPSLRYRWQPDTQIKH